ncbi:DUF4297 family anti-phage-associated protein [Flavobacterium sp.]|uniref:DUF4297 family anti-phage-associated protein n=1 Tax=Flavobacterium sp. TaxID=239 RepID=UPI003F6A4917
MTSRSADATIKGYYYQFDTSILRLLDLPSNTDTVTIEGIEDIDINIATETTAIQCKYLSKPRFINSAVREPITLMLEHFVNPATSNNYNYVLYAHFENETSGNEPTIDLNKLKEILTYTEKKVTKHYHIDNGITDAKLIDFIRQFKFVFGKEFNVQQQEVIQKLKAKFSCSEFEADTLYYNNALRIVIDKAIKKNVNQRILCKADFINEIDCSKKLFNEWFIKLRSKKEYLKLAAQNLKSTKALDPIRSKMIVIGKEVLSADNTELPIEAFIENLVTKFYKLNSALRDAKPLTIILDCDPSTVNIIKKSLIENEITFNDGYESICFSNHYFNNEPIINRTVNGQKILKSSYLVKIISWNSLVANISTIKPPKVLLNFSRDDLQDSFKTDVQYFDFKYCENLKDIYKLIAP